MILATILVCLSLTNAAKAWKDSYSKESGLICVFEGNNVKCIGKNLYNDDNSLVAELLTTKIGNSTTRLVLSGSNIMNFDTTLYFTERNKLLNELVLKQNKLYKIPEGVPQIVYLNIECNLIQDLSSESFNGYTNLREAKLSYNKIVNVPNYAFHKAVRLKHLQLAANNIWNFEEHAFKKLLYLQQLDFSFNEVRELKSNLFIDLTSLRSLTMEKNQITSIKIDTFRGLRHLQHLYARYNKIENIEARSFEVFGNSIQSIDLSDNQMKEIKPNVFHYLVKLKELRLSNNMISKIHSEAFTGVDVDILDLTNNNIKEVNHNMVTGLLVNDKLDLSGNPIKCDCNLHYQMKNYIDAWKIVGSCGGDRSDLYIRDVIANDALKCEPSPVSNHAVVTSFASKLFILLLLAFLTHQLY